MHILINDLENSCDADWIKTVCADHTYTIIKQNIEENVFINRHVENEPAFTPLKHFFEVNFACYKTSHLMQQRMLNGNPLYDTIITVFNPKKLPSKIDYLPPKIFRGEIDTKLHITVCSMNFFQMHPTDFVKFSLFWRMLDYIHFESSLINKKWIADYFTDESLYKYFMGMWLSYNRIRGESL
jgi:hypothetical protein